MVTVAIIDYPRCGTTMLAGICEIFGIPMVGEYVYRPKWEDYEVIEAIRQSEKAFAQVVAKRNAEHENWGFKFPDSWQHVPMMDKHLRDPVYLAIYKDPVSVTARRFGGARSGRYGPLLSTLHGMRKSLRGICALSQPVQLLSYSRAVGNPERFVRDMAKLVKVQPTEEQIAKAVAFIQPNRGRSRAPYPEVEPWLT